MEKNLQTVSTFKLKVELLARKESQKSSKGLAGFSENEIQKELDRRKHEKENVKDIGLEQYSHRQLIDELEIRHKSETILDGKKANLFMSASEGGIAIAILNGNRIDVISLIAQIIDANDDALHFFDHAVRVVKMKRAALDD